MNVNNNVTCVDEDVPAHDPSVVEVVALADAVRARVDSNDDITFPAAQSCAVPLADTVNDIGITDCLATHPVIEKNSIDVPSDVSGNVSVPVSHSDGVRAYDSFGVISRPSVVHNEVAPMMVDAVRTSSVRTADAPHTSLVPYKNIDEVAAGQTRVDQRIYAGMQKKINEAASKNDGVFPASLLFCNIDSPEWNFGSPFDSTPAAPPDDDILDEASHGEVASFDPSQGGSQHVDDHAEVQLQDDPGENTEAVAAGVNEAPDSINDADAGSTMPPDAYPGDSSALVHIVAPSDAIPLSFAMPTSTGKFFPKA